MVNSEQNISSYHLAGVIPLAGQPMEFNFPWHDCCMPLASDYLAIERAVLECAYAGCETIWIVCNDDIQPLIRHRLGDYINDPVWAFRKHDSRPSENRKQIPIFYVPVHPNDRDKRDCLAWSVLYGALSAYNISLKISKWVIPDRYYATFPYGVYPVEFLRQYRKNISSDKAFALSYCGKTIKNNEYLAFTFNSEDFIKVRKNLRKQATGKYITNKDGGIPKETLPLHERYSARFFTLDQVFKPLDLTNAFISEVTWYHNIDSWEGYCNFLASEDRKNIHAPSKHILNYREWNSIGNDY